MSVISLRLSNDLEQQLMKLAQATGRSKSWLAAQAVKQYLAQESWQVEEIKQALLEADDQAFCHEDEVNAHFKKWGVNGD